MKIKELRQLSSDELITKEKSFKKELFDLTYKKKIGAVEKPARFKNLRRMIAKIMTIIRERELDNERSVKAGK